MPELGTAPMLPLGRGERRTRIYNDRWQQVYDSATSDEHPEDFMRSRGLREANARIDLGPNFRWTGKICQRSRRRFDYINDSEFLRYITVWNVIAWENAAIPPAMDNQADPVCGCSGTEVATHYGWFRCTPETRRLLAIERAALEAEETRNEVSR